MSLFDDDFYSTRVRRKTRRETGRWQSSYGGRGFRQSSLFRVALLSSLASSLLVAVVFTLLVNRPAAPASRPAAASGPAVVETSERIITAAAKIRPAVVSIINRQKLPEGQSPDSGDDQDLQNASLGSGVIFEKKDGKAFIITNAHVVEDSGSLQAVLVNGTTKEAKIVGKDVITDLAVLEVDAKGIDAVAEIGDSGALREGETVIAVGNPLGLSDSLTDGIVSNLNRVLPVSFNQDGSYDWEEEVIQISAPINPGNSGGALVNLDGEVVGINSMKVADTGVEGIGFAIPIDDAMPVIRQLIAQGKVPRPYIGIYAIDLSSYLDGLALQESLGGAGDGEDDSSPGSGSADEEAPKPVVPDGLKNGVLLIETVGPAKSAGLKLNDIIVKLDGKPVDSMLELRKYLYNSKKIGESLTVTYYRDGKLGEAKLKLTESSEDNG